MQICEKKLGTLIERFNATSVFPWGYRYNVENVQNELLTSYDYGYGTYYREVPRTVKSRVLAS